VRLDRAGSAMRFAEKTSHCEGRCCGSAAPILAKIDVAQ
jgi:hypothetical protein